MNSKNNSIILALYNIRSVYNVGSLFRTADGAGISRLYLIGHTPTPVDRFGRERADLHKTALGAEKNIPWEYVPHWREMRAIIHQEQFQSVAIEQDLRSVHYENIPLGEKPLILILGNEVEGLPAEILDDVDVIAEIPMFGGKNSLNVSVAGGVVMYDLARRMRE